VRLQAAGFQHCIQASRQQRPFRYLWWYSRVPPDCIGICSWQSCHLLSRLRVRKWKDHMHARAG
jgi:hypothetical protein